MKKIEEIDTTSKKARLIYKASNILPWVVIKALVLGLILVFVYSLYLKREALWFAYTNSNQVVSAKESYLQEISKAEMSYKQNLSRSFIQGQ